MQSISTPFTLKTCSFNQLKDQLEAQSRKAFDEILAGQPLSKGTKLVHLEKIIRFLIKNLEQPSILEERDEEMELSVSQLSSIGAPKDR